MVEMIQVIKVMQLIQDNQVEVGLVYLSRLSSYFSQENVPRIEINPNKNIFPLFCNRF